MAEEQKKPHGARKVKHAREQGLLLFAGFALAVWMKADGQLFLAYVAGLTGLSGAFIYGNVKEHQSSAGPQPAIKPATQAS
jgi:hypothetical protein